MPGLAAEHQNRSPEVQFPERCHRNLKPEGKETRLYIQQVYRRNPDQREKKACFGEEQFAVSAPVLERDSEWRRNRRGNSYSPIFFSTSLPCVRAGASPGR